MEDDTVSVDPGRFRQSFWVRKLDVDSLERALTCALCIAESFRDQWGICDQTVVDMKEFLSIYFADNTAMVIAAGREFCAYKHWRLQLGGFADGRVTRTNCAT
jgi:hypothetical protein